MKAVAPNPRVLAACAALVIATFIAFSGVYANAFLNFDDDTYVTANPHVLSGLNGKSVAWALTSTEAANWHPVTWLSHMLNVQLFGLDAGKHHRTSVLLHAANAVLLFLVLYWMTDAYWRSVFVAVLFAIHPLHVESVAWIAERKDVLSTFFWLLTIAAWLRWIESKTVVRYAAVLALFALGLSSKPMLVTLPFTLLLLDRWPLHRTDTLKALVFEKAPLFAMSAASCVVTLIAQRRGGAFDTFAGLGFSTRLANAAVSYVVYLGRTVWPTALAVFYPYPANPEAWRPVAATLLLCGLSAAAIVLAKRAPYFAFGWAWYLGALVPVIGLLQVGAQATADRYTYVPLVGIFIAAAWGAAALAERGRGARFAVVALCVASLLALFALTRGQVRHWATSVSLFEHALAVTPNNDVAQINLGLALYGEGKPAEAIAHYQEALKLRPDSVIAHNDLGVALHATGQSAEAVDHFQQAIAGGLDSAEAHVNLGNALAGTGQFDAALEQYSLASKLDPNYLGAHRSLGNLLHRLRRDGEAIASFERAVALRPEDATTHLGLATALAGANRNDAALQQFNETLRLKPDSPFALNEMGNLLAKTGLTSDAIVRYEQAVRLKPDYVEALNNLGMALGILDRLDESIERLQQAVRINPNFAEAHNNLGISLASANRTEAALAEFELALKIRPDFENARTNLNALTESLKQKPKGNDR